MNCAECKNKKCHSKGKDCTNITDAIINIYKNNTDDLKMGRISSIVEKENYMKNPRLWEIIDFAKRMKYEHIGFVFCVGLSNEAEVLHKILEQHFKVSSVCCKVCGISKDVLEFEKMKEDESMCNPIGQAVVLNELKTDLNLIVGLCIGHDILFTKYSKAPVTTFIVKDRVLGHNPVAAIYSRYYKRLYNIAT